jgi:membrane protease YdiL (CAAX protease family)
MALHPDRRALPSVAPERGAVLALAPLAATLSYYICPPLLQEQIFVQLTPQLLAYGALALWASHNDAVLARLGLRWREVGDGLRRGLVTGIILGGLNTMIILVIVPSLGHDVTFLADTPHAKIPMLIMVPWFICAIAGFVEINFRGFLLGRLARLESSLWKSKGIQRLSPLALTFSTLAFAFDPFMVNTFKHLHWIALWDGLIWGLIWLRTTNLFITIVAHATEVMVMYLVVRQALTIGS